MNFVNGGRTGIICSSDKDVLLESVVVKILYFLLCPFSTQVSLSMSVHQRRFKSSFLVVQSSLS